MQVLSQLLSTTHARYITQAAHGIALTQLLLRLLWWRLECCFKNVVVCVCAQELAKEAHLPCTTAAAVVVVVTTTHAQTCHLQNQDAVRCPTKDNLLLAALRSS